MAFLMLNIVELDNDNVMQERYRYFDADETVAAMVAQGSGSPEPCKKAGCAQVFQACAMPSNLDIPKCRTSPLHGQRIAAMSQVRCTPTQLILTTLI